MADLLNMSDNALIPTNGPPDGTTSSYSLLYGNPPAPPGNNPLPPAPQGVNTSAPVPPVQTPPGQTPPAQTAPVGAGIPDTSFLSLLNNVNSGLQQNNSLVDQKNAVVQAMLGNTVDPAKLATLPPDIQKVIQGGNRDQLMLQAKVIDDALQGRNNTVASSIQYLTSGYQQAEQQKNQSLTTILNYAKALNQKPSDIIKAMYPDILSQMPPGQLAALDKLGAPLLTSTQVLPISGGDSSGYDLSTYASAPGYSDDINTIGSSIGPISSAADAQSYISASFPTSPITGDMITTAATQYGVDPTVLMSVLQKESQFGSDGSAGATMNNPGNVGNSDSAMAAGQPVGYPTMQDGINATAAWLADHKQSTNPLIQSYVDGIKNGTITSIAQVPAAYKNSVAMAMSDQGISTPLSDRRFVMAANGIIANYLTLPEYTLTANALPYLLKIDAAMTIPGSVSDQELLDSFTKLSTAGGVITDAQVSVITGGRSIADTLDVYRKKMMEGGVLSDAQRQQIYELGQKSYANLKKGYQPIYDKAISQLQASGIPEQYWTLPDLNTLSALSEDAVNAGGGPPGTSGGAASTASGVNDILSKYGIN